MIYKGPWIRGTKNTLCDSTSQNVETKEECGRAINALGIEKSVFAQQLMNSNVEAFPIGCIFQLSTSGKAYPFFNTHPGRSKAYYWVEPICRKGTTSLNYQLQTTDLCCMLV